jgi:Tol biopolymer transport system component
MVRIRLDLTYHRRMSPRSFLFFTSLSAIFCAILVAVCGILGFWQSSTEIAYICTLPREQTSICLTDADRGLTIQLGPDSIRMNNGVLRMSWSPDGEWLAFSGAVDGLAGLYLLEVRTGAISLLIRDGQNPAWSPDGKEIAFSRHNQLTRTYDLFIAELNGNNRLLYDSAGRGFNPTWSPDGSQIAFQDVGSDLYSIIYVINPDGSHLRALTERDGIYFDPAWSPDGDQIALHEGRTNEIVLLDLDDGAIQTVISSLDQVRVPGRLYDYNGSPSWSPDGQRIAFDSNTPRGYWQPRGWWVYVMNADGSGTYIIEHGYRPAWRPPRIAPGF